MLSDVAVAFTTVDGFCFRLIFVQFVQVKEIFKMQFYATFNQIITFEAGPIKLSRILSLFDFHSRCETKITPADLSCCLPDPF